MRTSEWVSPGHPDKIADAISEYILDRLIELDPKVRYALECQIKDEFVTLSGEITSPMVFPDVAYQTWAKQALDAIGYNKEYQEKWGKENTICSEDIKVTTHISEQSPDIAQGVDNDGWGDQGIFTGYAEKTSTKLPLDQQLAKEIGSKIYKQALNGEINGGLDIKTQVTLNNDDTMKQVIVACPVLNEDGVEEIKSMVQYWVEVEHSSRDVEIIVNGTGAYKIHGPIGDCGTTGRKLAVDFYGNNAPIGGGSPWTKDASKADLSLNLFAREMAVKGLEEHPEGHHAIYQTSSCIGSKRLLGQLTVYDRDRNVLLQKDDTIDLGPTELTERYGLKKPNYFSMTVNGLFGCGRIWDN